MSHVQNVRSKNRNVALYCLQKIMSKNLMFKKSQKPPARSHKPRHEHTSPSIPGTEKCYEYVHISFLARADAPRCPP